MIYEVLVTVKADATEDQIKDIKTIVTENVDSVKGSILISDDWGMMMFAQSLSGKHQRGKYIYFMYKSSGTINKEIIRKLSINETAIRYLIVQVGEDRFEETFVKEYQNPHHTTNADNMLDEELEKDRKMFSKKRSCWFSANKTKPDWKNPKTYSWLLNEFGKISPARVSGLRPRFQRMSNDAIKRGRMMGLVSFVSDETAYRA